MSLGKSETRKKVCLVGILFLFLMVLTACSSVETVSGTSNSDPKIPRITNDSRGWIDTTETISQSTLDALRSESEAAKKDGFEIAGAIFNNCASDEVEFAAEVGDENGIGDSEKDNGIMFAVYLEKEGRDGNAPVLAIAIGSGLESLLNDAKVGRFLDQYYVPERANGNWEVGLVNTEKAIRSYLTNPEAEEYKEINKEADYSWVLWLIIIIIILLVADGCTGWHVVYFISEIASSSSSGGSGGFGSGGGFSGGGSSR